MELLKTIESKLDQWLVKDAPVQLPESWRQWIATYAWVFALIGFVLGIILLTVLLPLLGFASFVGAVVMDGGRIIFFSWLSFLVMLAYVILVGMSVSKLKVKQKAGWDLIFYGALLFVVYDIVYWLQSPGFSSIFMLLWQLAWATVGLYLIFQVRSQFKETGKVTNTRTTASKKRTRSKKK